MLRRDDCGGYLFVWWDFACPRNGISQDIGHSNFIKTQARLGPWVKISNSFGHVLHLTSVARNESFYSCKEGQNTLIGKALVDQSSLALEQGSFLRRPLCLHRFLRRHLSLRPVSSRAVDIAVLVSLVHNFLLALRPKVFKVDRHYQERPLQASRDHQYTPDTPALGALASS